MKVSLFSDCFIIQLIATTERGSVSLALIQCDLRQSGTSIKPFSQNMTTEKFEKTSKIRRILHKLVTALGRRSVGRKNYSVNWDTQLNLFILASQFFPSSSSFTTLNGIEHLHSPNSRNLNRFSAKALTFFHSISKSYGFIYDKFMCSVDSLTKLEAVGVCTVLRSSNKFYGPRQRRMWALWWHEKSKN